MKITSITEKTTPPKSDKDPRPIQEKTVVFKGENGVQVTLKGYEAEKFEQIDIGREAYLTLQVEKRKQKQITEKY